MNSHDIYIFLGLLEQHLVSCIDKSSHNLMPLLLIVRQTCTESNAKFQTYGKFYEYFFCSNREIANCSKRMANLLRIFSQFVPQESHAALMTHLSNPLPVPTNLKELDNDYKMLARTRCSDLKGQATAMTTGLFGISEPQVTHEVDDEIKKGTWPMSSLDLTAVCLHF